MRPSARLLLAALLCGLLTCALPSAPASATTFTSSSFAARLVQLLNTAREHHGLAPLTVASGTTAVASGWTQRLATDQRLSHNPDLQAQLESHGSKDWTVLAENVGDSDAQDPDGLFDAYMASPEHRANILTAKFRYLGNAVVFAGGRAWNTMDFVDAYSSTTKPVAKPTATTTTRQSAAPVAASPTPARRAAAPAKRAARAVPASRPRGTAGVTPAVALPMISPVVQAAHLEGPAASVVDAVVPLDRRRVLALAVAAMLAILVGGAWVGVALPARS